MKSRVYIETTVISYLTARQSPQLVMAAHQQATQQWWDEQRDYFELFISEAVVEEAAGGDSEAAERRLTVLAEIPRLEINDSVRSVAKDLIAHGRLPAKASLDAVHIATATINGMDYLLTWNCRHIANATLQKHMNKVCETAGLMLPQLCTPLELIEVSPDE